MRWAGLVRRHETVPMHYQPRAGCRMYQPNVLLTSHNQSLGRAHELLRRLERAWGAPQTCHFDVSAFEDVDEVVNNQTVDGVIVLFDDQNDPAATYELLQRLENADIATIVLTADEHDPK